jgi:CheY-like chemotaxis protein
LVDRPLASRSILVIDDDAQIRELVATTLGQVGAEVRLAGSGRDGLELARTQPPELVLLDLSMPEMDGWHVLRELRARPETARIPVVLLTSANDVASYEKSRQHAVAAFISKPFRLAELTGFCRHVLETQPEDQGGVGQSTSLVTDTLGRALGRAAIIEHDDEGAMLEMELPPQLGERVALAGGELALTGEVRWVRAVGERFQVGLRIDR